MSVKPNQILEEIHFDIQRKIVGNMTTESWQNIPHAVYVYEPDVTDFMQEYESLKKARAGKGKITVNLFQHQHLHANRAPQRSDDDDQPP